MMDWEESSVKLLGMLKERAKEIRKALPPAERFIEAAVADLSSSGVDFSESKEWEAMPENDQVSLIASLIGGINKIHWEGIKDFLWTVGEVLEVPSDASFSGDRFLEEDESSITVLFERARLKIDKDVALKILTLGHIP